MRRQCAIPAVIMTGTLIAAPAVLPPAANAATAYTLEPLNYNHTETTPTLFNGAVCVIYDCVKVPTPAALDPSHREGVFEEDGPISVGAASLDSVLRADPDDKLVFGFSQGAQVGGFWLRNYAPTTSVEPGNTSFLFVGDPENTYGVPWAPRVPTDTGFAVTEVWAQYDGWADWPTRFDLLATANAVYGMLFVHPVVYDDMDLDAERAAGNVVTWESDGITYEMVRDDTLPLLDPLRNIGLGWAADLVNDDWREHIEAQYDRPSSQEEADATYGAPDPDPESESESEPNVEADAEEERAEKRSSTRSVRAERTDKDEPDTESDTDLSSNTTADTADKAADPRQSRAHVAKSGPARDADRGPTPSDQRTGDS